MNSTVVSHYAITNALSYAVLSPKGRRTKSSVVACHTVERPDAAYATSQTCVSSLYQRLVA